MYILVKNVSKISPCPSIESSSTSEIKLHTCMNQSVQTIYRDEYRANSKPSEGTGTMAAYLIQKDSRREIAGATRPSSEAEQGP
ncbi:hypothetical protein NDU88_002822 [Pleurodeles waltl]|uniref:Uncharacterized protein n=1 Tax=Pleurodeles waltl TaxID=8319 RepID=A0AAV7MPW6_PLEWA|nr:hypothetical protein NDU88_002822 [Pleurodeles waltl]